MRPDIGRNTLRCVVCTGVYVSLPGHMSSGAWPILLTQMLWAYACCRQMLWTCVHSQLAAVIITELQLTRHEVHNSKVILSYAISAGMLKCKLHIIIPTCVNLLPISRQFKPTNQEGTCWPPAKTPPELAVYTYPYTVSAPAYKWEAIILKIKLICSKRTWSAVASKWCKKLSRAKGLSWEHVCV